MRLEEPAGRTAGIVISPRIMAVSVRDIMATRIRVVDVDKRDILRTRG